MAASADSLGSDNLYKNVNDLDEDMYTGAKHMCLPFLHSDGNRYFLRIIKPAEMSSAQAKDAVKSFIMPTIYIPHTFPTAPDGIYTWILGDAGFFAGKVRSKFEFGTIHKQLADLTGTRRIYVAGECRKTGTNIEYNLMSGTYTRNMISSRWNNRSIQLKNTPTYKKLSTTVIALFDGMGFTTDPSHETTFITDELTPITKEELDEYKAAGFQIEMFQDKNLCILNGPITSQNTTKLKLLEQQIKSGEKILERGIAAAARLRITPESVERYKQEKATLDANIASRVDEYKRHQLFYGGVYRRKKICKTRRIRKQTRVQRKKTRYIRRY